MNLSDITKINFGSAGISAVYNGTIKLWPKQVVTDNKVMKFTIVSGDTWEKTGISAFTADNKYITPVKKDATGWTYDEEVGYFKSSWWYFDHKGTNLLTFEGFPKAVKFKSGANFFYDNNKCTDISTGNIDTSECTDMNSMFNGCRSLTTLDVSNFNTSQVTNMDSLFNHCNKLASLDVSKFDTSKVTNMGGMFSYCESLTSLDLSNFNTSQVTNMSNMFSGCESLTSLDLSNFNTSQVTNMSRMFYYCKILTSLDLSNFDTLKVTNMNDMFETCFGLATLDLSNWDTSNVTSMNWMFSNCFALKTVKMTNCSQETKDKIRAALDAEGLTSTVITE